MPDPLIIPDYTDALGTVRHSPAWALDHVREVLAEPRTAGGCVDVVRVRAGAPSAALAGRTLRVETGGDVVLGSEIPVDLPYGYHQLDDDRGPVLVLHAPAQVPSAGEGPGWVVAAQLYASPSARSWGHGDLADAHRLTTWIDEAGPGGHLMLNPLHAPLPGPYPQPSPYFASSRVFRNPIYLDLDALAGPDPAAATALAGWRAAARAHNGERLLARPAVWAAKRAALGWLWARDRNDAATAARVTAWLADPVQRRYASFAARTEAAEGRPPAPDAAPSVLGEADDAERFQAWLQLRLEDQLHAVGGRLIHDVAVGTDRAGADAWLWPDCFVLDGTRIGCPPDQFNTLGQDWGLPPLHPLGLRAAGHEPFVRAVRSAATGAAGIRLDHVMGLERLFWIPEAGSPPDGVYVQYPLDELLDVVAIEAHRAGAFVVGEDLGTVPPSIPVALAERGMLSYKIASLDATHPHEFPERAMAAVTTHDLATTVGLLTGSDLEDQRRLDLAPNEQDTWDAIDRLRAWVHAWPDTPVPELVVRIHALLAESPALLAAVTLDDLALATERPNMPGTIDAWPNWSIALPALLEDVLAGPEALALRTALAARATPAPVAR